ncbi:hypothetical protein CDAR_60461 [Caerostris darwini]|uniref:Secreted protein n=1 Tax=Caerostris darwini TaxID=1538125 RepID=A0AAV4QK45_9ARAC|nr:hypothetical protein CDAR_60461 [Caerostris darwini]
MRKLQYLYFRCPLFPTSLAVFSWTLWGCSSQHPFRGMFGVRICLLGTHVWQFMFGSRCIPVLSIIGNGGGMNGEEKYSFKERVMCSCVRILCGRKRFWCVPPKYCSFAHCQMIIVLS